MSEILGELNTDKKRFAKMMYRLSRLYRSPDGELSAEVISMYWEKLKGYPIDILLKGMDDLLDEHNSHWFPLIPEIKQATLKIANRNPTKRLPEPDDGPTLDDLRNNRYNLEWIVLYFCDGPKQLGSHMLCSMIPTDDKKRLRKTVAGLTPAEKKRYGPFLKADDDTDEDRNQKRRAYVKLRKQMDGVE